MAKKKTYPTRTAAEQDDAKKLLKRVISSVDTYHHQTRDARNRSLEDFNYNEGGDKQWDPADLQKLRKEKRTIATFNLIKPVVDFIAGYQKEREQDYRAFPRGSEDEQLGRLMTANMRYAMDCTRGAHVFHQGFRKGLIGGQAVFEVGHSFDLTDDYLEGDIKLDILEANTWGHEPGARLYTKNDAEWQYKLIWTTPEAAARRWPQHQAVLQRGAHVNWLKEDPASTGVPQHLLQELVDDDTGRIRILQYWYRVPVEVALLVDSRTGDVRRFQSEDEADKEIERIHNTAGETAASQFSIEKAKSQSALINGLTGQVHTFRKPEHAEEALDRVRKQAGSEATEHFELVVRPTTALRVANVCGWELLDDGPSPHGSDWRYPFVPFTCYQDTDDLNSIKGVVRDIKDPQREVNWHHATMLDTVVRGPKGGVWLSKQDQVDVEKLRAQYARPGFIGEYAGSPPIPVAPQVLSPGDMELLQFGIDSIMRIAGVNAEMMGQTTQKTVSGRAIQSRQAGGLVGIGSLLLNWTETKQLVGELLLRRIQQYYSPEKMDRIIGQQQRILQQAGILGPESIPDEQMYEYFKQLQYIDMDIVVDFQEVSPTARAAVATQMMQFKAAGAPIPLEMIVEASDMPYSREIISAIRKQGEQMPDPNLAKAVAAGQGQSGPSGVNATA
jgi:hypothetical protein